MGKGEVLFWQDNWSGLGSLSRLLQEDLWNSSIRDDVLLNEVLNNAGEWNFYPLDIELPDHLKEILYQIPIRIQDCNDRLV